MQSSEVKRTANNMTSIYKAVNYSASNLMNQNNMVTNTSVNVNDMNKILVFNPLEVE